MANYERDHDDVHVFDGGDDEDIEGSRLPLLIVIALLVLAAFTAVVWLAYQRGVSQGHSEAPRIIAAEPGPAKVAPANPGGTPTPYTGLKIYQQPAPDSPDAAAPAAATPPAGRSAPTAASPAPSAPAMTPAPAKAAGASGTPDAKAAGQTTPMPVATHPPLKLTPAPEETPAVAPPKPRAAPPPTKVATAPPPASVKAATQLPAPPKPATPKPAAAVPSPAAPMKAATPPPAPMKTAALPPAAATPAAPGGVYVQIGSYKSQAEAEAALTAYKGRHASLVGSASTNVQSADLGSRGAWYRSRFAVGSREEAVALCEKLKADGGTCILAH